MTIRPIHLLPPLLLLFGLVLVLAFPHQSQVQGTPLSASEEFSHWTVNGSAFYQFQSDLDHGGDFSAKRFFINGRWPESPGPIPEIRSSV
jgi:hypothetical protein